MSLNVTFNGAMYIIPETGEVGWGGNVTSYLVALAAGALQKTGGSFTLSAETDFGASFGLKSLYYKSRSANIATTGILRLANNSDSVSWRNFANSGDLPLTVDASDRLSYNGVPVLTGTGPSDYVSSITGTANQVIASASTGAVTLSLPQSINSTANVQFGTLGLGSAVVSSSILSLTSTTLGFLPSRMTTAQRDAIVSPATGLFIYNTSTTVYNYFNGSVWVAIAAGGTINAGVAGFFSYYPTNGTTLDDQAILSTDGTNLTIASGQLLIPNGNTSLPAVAFTLDPDTGIYLSSSNVLGLVGGGVEGLTVSPTNVRLQLDTIESRSVPGGTVLLRVTNTAPAGANTFGTIRAEHDSGAFAATAALNANLSATNLRQSELVMNGTPTIASQGQGGVAEQTTQINVFDTVLITAMNLPKTGEVQFRDGTALLPSITFQTDPDTGMYRTSANELGFTTGGVLRFNISSFGIETRNSARIYTGDGSASTPGFSFVSDPDTGMYLIAPNHLGFAVGGALAWQINTTGDFVVLGGSDNRIMTSAGSAALPSYSFNFSGGTTTGMYLVATDHLGFSVAGTLAWQINPSGDFVVLGGSDNRIMTSAGTAAVPSYSFNASGGTTTGMYLVGTDTLGFSTGGSLGLQIESPTNGVSIFGVTSGIAATAGTVGQFVESVQNSNVNSPGTNQWFDITSISLPAGDWDVWIIAGINSANYTVISDMEFGISTTAGNVSPGSQISDWVSISGTPFGKINQTFYKRYNTTSTATYYCKAFVTFSSGTQSGIGKIWARRRR